MRSRTYRSPWLLVIIALIGIVTGGIIGDLLQQFVPILGYSKSLGLKPTTLDLSVLSITFGFLLRMTLASTLGLILSVFIYFRL